MFIRDGSVPELPYRDGPSITGWRWHLAGGLVTVVVTVLVLQWLLPWLPSRITGGAGVSLEAFLAGTAAGLIGSLLPDMDLRGTKVRYVGGPLLGLALAIMVGVNDVLTATGEASIMDVTPRAMVIAVNWPRVIMVYIFMVLAAILVGFFPMKHRKRLHSIVAAGVYALFWAVTTMLLMRLGFIDVVVVILLAYLGYLSHLVLDRDVKTWKRPTHRP